nr:translation initiation factor IF-2 [Chloroflexota bacterium]
MPKQKTTHTSSIDAETKEPASDVNPPADKTAREKPAQLPKAKGAAESDASKAKTAEAGPRQAQKGAKIARDGRVKVAKAGKVKPTRHAKAPPRGSAEGKVPGAAQPAAKRVPAKTKKPAVPQPSMKAAVSAEATETEPPKILEAVAVAEPEAPPTSNVVTLPLSITVRDLAALLKASPITIIRELMKSGVMANINQEIDFDTAAIVASDLGFEVKEERPPEPVEELPQEPVRKRREYTAEELAKLAPRPPVVTIMGHVDHGKTSLLDVIRQTNVVASEVGGITQHIGAYQVEVQGKKITFLDTPGHEAFTAMRARGAMVTDIAVLVVAADDGVQPQTIEAINHARAAQVPIIVALNKIDKPNANPEVVKRQLSEIGLLVEDYGGDVICVPVSAKQKIGLETLLEMILLVAEMADLKANPEALASGTVIEGRLDKTKGPLATLLVQEGTLHLGDSLVIGDLAGKVRAMFDDKGQRIESAPPAMPVVVLGLSDVPAAGEPFRVVKDEHEARALAAAEALRRQQAAEQQKRRGISLDEFFAKAQAGQAKELNLILKADVQGSIEPIVNSVEKLGDEKLRVKLLHTGLGNINESDIMLAVASQAIVIGFNVQVDAAASRMAESEGVDIRLYNIIYHLVDDIDRALKGLLEPSYKDVTIGHAEVRAVFRIGHKKQVAGCQVMDGIAARNALVRVRRADKVIFEGQVASLRRFKEDVREVNTGLECGVGVEGFDDFAVGDILEFYRKEQVGGTVA